MSNKKRAGKVFQLPKRQIDHNELPSFHCPGCGKDVFRKVFSYRQLSGIVSASGQNEIMQLGPLLECSGCGKVLNQGQLVLVQPDNRVNVNTGGVIIEAGDTGDRRE